ncbi:MAG: hypothetical protein IJA10_15555 [Lachnospiraceae bacterium]|nr:hypothetical protein [Lachnospiraceae bacterium]
MTKETLTRIKTGISSNLIPIICTLSAVVAILFMIIYLFTFDVFLPPAGAMTILAMLIPETMLFFYPVQVFFGVLILSVFGIGIKGKVGVLLFKYNYHNK